MPVTVCPCCFCSFSPLTYLSQDLKSMQVLHGGSLFEVVDEAAVEVADGSFLALLLLVLANRLAMAFPVCCCDWS